MPVSGVGEAGPLWPGEPGPIEPIDKGIKREIHDLTDLAQTMTEKGDFDSRIQDLRGAIEDYLNQDPPPNLTEEQINTLREIPSKIEEAANLHLEGESVEALVSEIGVDFAHVFGLQGKRW